MTAALAALAQPFPLFLLACVVGAAIYVEVVGRWAR